MRGTRHVWSWGLVAALVYGCGPDPSAEPEAASDSSIAAAIAAAMLELASDSGAELTRQYQAASAQYPLLARHVALVEELAARRLACCVETTLCTNRVLQSRGGYTLLAYQCQQQGIGPTIDTTLIYCTRSCGRARDRCMAREGEDCVGAYFDCIHGCPAAD